MLKGISFESLMSDRYLRGVNFEICRVISRFSAPAMPVHQLQIQRDTSGVIQAFLHCHKTLPAGQALCSLSGRIACAYSRQIGEQLSAACVADRQAIYVQDGIAQPGVDQAVTQVVHIGESIHMNAVIDLLPGSTDLLKAIRTERCERKNTVFSQHPRDFGKNRAGIVKPRQQHVRKNYIDTSVWQWQCTGICLSERAFRQPGFFFAGLPQHVVGEVDRDKVGTLEALYKASIRGTGGRSKIDDGFRVDQQGCEAREKALACFSMYEISVIKACRSAFKPPANMFGVQHRRNVSTLS